MRDLARIILGGGGAALLITSLLAGLAWLVWPLLNPGALLSGSILLAGLATLGLLYGLLLLVQTFRDYDFVAPWPPAWIVFILWLGVLALGGFVRASVEQDLLAPWILSFLNVLAVGLPILGILAYAMRRTAAPAGRVGLQLVYGGTIAFALSLLVEVGVLLIVGALLLAVSGQGTGLGQWLLALVGGNLGSLGDLRASPVLLAGVIGARIFLTPVIQEAAKALNLPLWGGWQPNREQAMVWGLAAGLGFALSQGMVGTALAAEAAWWPSLLGRAGAALVHGMATAIVGLGWWRATSRRQPLSLVAAYIAAVAVHGFWNLGDVARALIADTPLGTVTTTEPALDVLLGDMIGILGAALLLALLAGVLIRVTSRDRWVEAS